MKNIYTFIIRPIYLLISTCFLLMILSNNSYAQCVDDGNTWNQSWKSCILTPNPNAARLNSHWLLFSFDEPQNIDSTHIWNANRAGESIDGIKTAIIDYSVDDSTWIQLGSFNFPQGTEQSDYEGFDGPNLGGIWVKKILITVQETYGNGSCASLAEIQFQVDEDACYGEVDACGNCNGPGETVWYKDEDGDGLGTQSIVTMACEQPIGYVENADDDCDNGLLGWNEIEFIFMENGCRGCHGTNGAGGLDLTSYVSTIQGGNNCGTDILTGNTLASIIMVDGYNGCGTPISSPSMNARTGGMIDSIELAAIQTWIDAGAPENCNCVAGAPDNDGDGICDAVDECPNFNNNLIGTACDDGLVCTDNDVWVATCECKGTPRQDTDDDGVCDDEDLAPNNPCTADGVMDGVEPAGWIPNPLNDCDVDGVTVVQGDLNDYEACVNEVGSLTTAACNCGTAVTVEGGTYISSVGINNAQRADGLPDSSFTSYIGGNDSLYLQTSYLSEGEIVCITTRFTDPDGRIRVEANGELFTLLNGDPGNDQRICYEVRTDGIQNILIKDGGAGGIYIDGLDYNYCPCTDFSVNGDPDTSAVLKAYSNLTGWQVLTEATFFVCEGDSLALGLESGIASSFDWTGPGIGLVQAPELAVGIASPADEGLYTATYTNSNGCVVRKDIQVYVEAAPQISYVKVDPVCTDPSSGIITFSFDNNPNRSSLEFSINGQNGPYRTVADDIGSFSMTDLESGSYDLWARWESNHIEINLGQVVLMGCNEVEVSAFLEGPMRNDSMGTFIISQMDNLDPYLGLDSSANIPSNVVDWVLVQIRDSADSRIVLAQRAAFITSQGQVISTGGNSKLGMRENIPDRAYIALLHRNHLGVMTADPVDLSQPLDFSDPNTAVYGLNPRKMINGKAVMYAGDCNQDGSINAVDKNNYWRLQNGQPFEYGQGGGDMNMDGSVNVIDANGYWRINNGKLTQIPN